MDSKELTSRVVFLVGIRFVTLTEEEAVNPEVPMFPPIGLSSIAAGTPYSGMIDK